jgi:hypothetical protein
MLGLALALGASGALGSEGRTGLAIAALVVALPCLALACWERRLARRAQIGARSERIVRAALRPLERGGWTVRHSIVWTNRRWRGDIDHVAVAPDRSVAFAIETKTRSYAPEHLARTRDCADWVGRKWRETAASYAVLCVTRGPSRCDVEEGVIVCSVDRLADALASTVACGAPHTERGPGSVLAFVGRWMGA